MKLIGKSEAKIRLEYSILKVLKAKYSNALEIKNSLNDYKIDYNMKDFFPVLSHLFLNKYLCYNWIDVSGNNVKYYHITPVGKDLINNTLKVN